MVVLAGSAGVAGADTSGYTLTCTLTKTALPIPNTVTTGTLPASVTPGKSFTLTNYGLKLTLPASGVFAAAAGHTIHGTYTTNVTAIGATPATQSTTFTVPTTSLPKPLPATGAPLSATAAPVSFTAGDAAGTASVSTGTSGQLALTVSTVGLVKLSSATPAVVIASTSVAAPKTAVTSVLPNSGPLAGGESVTIDGTFFTGASDVRFGTTSAASYSFVSSHVVTATSPPGAAGPVDVTVTTPIGTSALSSG